MESSFDFFLVLWYSVFCSNSDTKKKVKLYGKSEGYETDRAEQKSIS